MSVLLHAILDVQSVHEPDIDPDQDNKGHQRALVGEPEPEGETADPVGVELIGEQDAAKVGHREPDGQKNRDDDQVFFPLCL